MEGKKRRRVWWGRSEGVTLYNAYIFIFIKSILVLRKTVTGSGELKEEYATQEGVYVEIFHSLCIHVLWARVEVKKRSGM